MKPWMKSLLYGSIFMALFFFYKLEQSFEFPAPQPQYIQAIDIPQHYLRQSIKIEELTSNLSEKKAFRPLFFENMKLKGIMKDSFNRWIAIFSEEREDLTSDLLKLAVGDTHDGIKLLEIDHKSCLVRYGSIERKFEL